MPTDNLKLLDDIANYMTYPYGLMFNCLYSLDNVFFGEPPKNGSFAASIVFYSEPITNILFNAGQLYSDVAKYINLNTVDPNYWYNAGLIIGDFITRFFWRNTFS